MDYTQYITKKRFRGVGLSGPVNIHYGTECTAADGTILRDGQSICYTTSQNAYDYFAQNDDGQGAERGKLTDAIIARLAKRDNGHQARWDKVWADALCQKYKRSDYDDYWLWNSDFYNAPIEDLQYIHALTMKGVRPHV